MPVESLIASGRDCAPPLTPKLAPWMQRFLERPEIARSLIESQGSPTHVVVTSEFGRNVRDLTAPLKSRNVAGGLFFARKANKLRWFVTAAKEEGIGVDTASLQEVEQTIALGVPPQQIVITAIGKTQKLVETAIASGCLLVIDNADELDLVRAVAQSLGRTARIGLRFSGFQVKARKVFSRFGFPVEDANSVLTSAHLDAAPNGRGETPPLQVEFLHAHIDRYDTSERACAALQLIDIADLARSIGHQVSAIDLGGGILMRYLESAEEWASFGQELIASVRGDRPYWTYLDDGLGYYRAGEQVLGQADLYPAWNDLSKERFISAVLDYTENGAPLHRELSGRGLKLFFEPGRALLDNTGMTLASVAFRKRDTLGNLLIGVSMNSTNLRPFRAEFCSDPILLSNGQRVELTEGAFIVGCLCSESDLIFRRKLDLRRLPEPGDIMCFANSAGYLAHHLEVGTHGNPLPGNVLLDPDSWEVCSALAGGDRSARTNEAFNDG